MTAISGPGVPVTHVAAPIPDTAYTMEGPRTGRLLDKRYHRSWPAEGICSCGQVVRQEAKDAGWEHIGRMPGDSI